MRQIFDVPFWRIQCVRMEDMCGIMFSLQSGPVQKLTFLMWRKILFGKIGNGKKINLWKDNWYGQPLVSRLQIHEDKHHNLKAMLSDIILNNCIVLPNRLALLHPELSLMVVENMEHLFFSCKYATSIWNWLKHLLDIRRNISSLEDCKMFMNSCVASQCKDVITTVFVNTIKVIWLARNQTQFQDVVIP